MLFLAKIIFLSFILTETFVFFVLWWDTILKNFFRDFLRVFGNFVKMSNYVFNLVWGLLFFVAVTFFQPALVLAEESESEPGWVLAYALVLLFLAAIVAILAVRLAGRRDTVFSDAELSAKREEEIKKATKH